jgi:hypothetical protein
MAAVGGYMHPFDTSMVAMSKTARPTTCYIQKNGCLNTGQSSGNWYWLSRVPMIRMNMGAASSINENYFKDRLEVFPNPSNRKITLELNKVSNDNYKIEIINILGKSIYFSEEYIDGFYKKEVDVSSFSKGVYLIKVSNSKATIFSKLVVE